MGAHARQMGDRCCGIIRRSGARAALGGEGAQEGSCGARRRPGRRDNSRILSRQRSAELDAWRGAPTVTEAASVPAIIETASGRILSTLNWLRAGVLGANDGVVSTAAI